ncbi:LOW QUALITY PROTEIN: killer cell lectin-like receptor subfamily F member 1 [Gopherus evgoodei]|uniref:LOW QUALITY PROTEIN: killer cell lectin-like receptor subfamily F member 1 n=1 Tax=Gopherus evgoodei TaxID=1825980 RepID=UPI0011D015D9|nr:LOW QUALITY PROTEIN: killer cell lectin-like receptor subfamily F member 1 [Gopherus evgoodei]
MRENTEALCDLEKNPWQKKKALKSSQSKQSWQTTHLCQANASVFARSGSNRSRSSLCFQTNIFGGRIPQLVESVEGHCFLLFSSFSGQTWKMEDEEGYTVLNPRCQEKTTTRLSPGRIQGSPLSSQCCKRMLVILGAVCIILTLAVIILTILVFQCGSHEGQTGTPPNAPADSDSGQRRLNSAEGSSSPEDVLTHLRQNLCELQTHSSADEGSECKLCPMDWLSHRGKCYWFSKGNKDWNGSRDDCPRKKSHILVIQDQDEMEFIQNVTQGKYPVWIGLNVTSPEEKWTWVDGSILNQTLFPVSGPAVRNSCGVIKGNQLRSEMCSAEFKWICQKEAVMI